MTYLKINDTLYPATFFERGRDNDWDNRRSMAITVGMTYEQAAQTFVNGLQWSLVNQDIETEIRDCSEYEVAGPITDNRNGAVTAKMGKAVAADTNAVLTGAAQPMTIREATELRQQMETVYQLAAPSMTADEVIQNRVMCKVWEAGVHTAGEVYSTGEQLWQCIQDYDNAVYPDIIPGNPAWNTFHKPYHGTTKETALPWVAPTGAHDMYLTGEYMVWTDGSIQRCKADTVYNPEEYADAWEVAD